MLDLAEVGNGVWDEGFGKDGLRPFELATIRLQHLGLHKGERKVKRVKLCCVFKWFRGEPRG